MTDLTVTEHALRDHLDRQTDAVPGGPDLGRSLREGRRRRRTRSLGAAAAGVATAAVVGTVAVVGLTGDDGPAPGPVDDPGAAAAPADPTDFVAGTDVDTRFAALVAEHLPALPDPDDVYPSDFETAGALPDDAFPRATEWQAVYTPEQGSQVLVLMGLPVPGEDPADTCDGAGVPVRGCQVEEEPAGSLLVTQEYSTDDGFTSFTSQVDADGFRVSVLDTRPTPKRTLDDVLRAHGLVTDPRFTFEQGK